MKTFHGKSKFQILLLIKVSQGVGLLRRIKKFVPQQTMINVYNSVILPYFDYCFD
jgi:hypothetical protein